MEERYIRRGTLPPQRFSYHCPVVLAAGALLEDTRQPRLVGQLKWGASKGTVTSLTVTLHCEGARPGDVTFIYQGLRVLPGRPFGQYSAILLPPGTTGFTVTVEEVTFLGGAVWDRETARAQAEQAQAVTPPVTVPAPEKAKEAAPAAPTRAGERPAKAEQKAPAPKGKGKVLAGAALLAVVLAAALFFLTGQDGTPAGPGTNLPSEATRQPGEATAAPEGGDPAAGSSKDKPSAGTPSEGKPSQGTPNLTGPVQATSSVDLGETGDIAAVYIHPDESGYYRLSPDRFTDYIPGCVTTCAWIGPDLGEDVLTYLTGSFSFALYVGIEGISGDETQYPMENGKLPPRVCVLAFGGEGNSKLIGYFIGLPEQYDENTIRIDMTLCDYDLLPLYDRERAAFLDGVSQLEDLPVVEPEPDRLEALGAKYFIHGYYTGPTTDPADDDCQRYHLWKVLNTPEMKGLICPVDQIKLRSGRGRGRYKFCLLLDKNYEPIGYICSD